MSMQWIQSAPVRGALVALLLAVVSPGCSVNPATGKQQLNLISESQEIAMGKEADGQIVAQMGLYPDQAMQAYVQSLGAQLAASSERPHLAWTFRVLDDPLVNAFALPGGYVYVTRGILAHLESEAELAGVLGHEIGHVTARHSVNQMSKQQLAGLGLGIGMMVRPELQQLGDLAATGMGLLFLKYSRDDEHQADELGLRYALRVNYDPREIPAVFSLLERVSASAGSGRAPSWLATHPDPGQRRQWMQAEVAKLNQDWSRSKVNARSYQQRLDGMVFGDNPRDGYFEEGRFLHPELAFSLDFPAGWKTQNQRDAVIGVSAKEDALMQLTLTDAATPEEAVAKFIAQEGVEGGRVETRNRNGVRMSSARFEVPREQSSLSGRVVAVRDGERTFQVLGFALKDQWSGYASAVDEALGSYQRISNPAVLNVQPRRLSMVDIKRGLTLEEFQRSYPSTVPLQTLGLLNRLDSAGRLETKDLAKRVVGGPGT